MRKPYEETSFAIVIPYTGDMVHLAFVQGLLKMKLPPRHEIFWIGNTITSAARNTGVFKALQGNFDYLFFMDSDMVFPPETLHTLWENDVPIVSGMYQPRRGGGNYFAFDYIPEMENFSQRVIIKWTEKLIKIGGAGTGCLLINCDVFRQLEPPWFFYDEFFYSNEKVHERLAEEIKNGVLGNDLEADMRLLSYGYGKGEDLNFFKKCYEADIPAYLDTTVFCGHLTTVSMGNPSIKKIHHNKKGKE